MQNIIQNHYIIAVFIARIFLGFLFFLQGYDTIIRVGIKNVIEKHDISFSEGGIPRVLTSIGVWFTSCIQVLGGLFLIVGFVKYYVLYLLGIEMILAAIAFGIIKPLWDMRFIFPRFTVLIFLLVVPSEWDVLSVDYFWSFLKFLNSF